MSTGDIGLFIQSDFTIDIKIEAGDLAGDDGLQTAVLLSLFSDQRALPDELPPEDSSHRGWWGDVFPVVEGDQGGSKLWLLKREKRTVETLNRAEEYSTESLQWMIDDGVAETVEASASWDPTGALLIQILITEPGSGQAKTFRFKAKWDLEGERS